MTDTNILQTKPVLVVIDISEALQPLLIAGVHDATLGTSLANSRIADTVLTAQIGDGNPGLVLFHNAGDLVFGKPATLHLWSSPLGQSLPETGLGGGVNVTGSCSSNQEKA